MMRRPSITSFALLFIIAAMCLGASSLPAYAATSLQEEIDLGKKIDAEILKQNQLTDDEAAAKEIEEVGQRLAKGVRRTEIKYHFRILKDDEFNAFSIPGGYVYFTDRIWNVLRPDERTGVLAHEIVHSDRRHALDAMSKQQKRRLWLGALLAVVGASRTVGDIASFAESLYTLKYSRGDEQQADEVGVELCREAGYNPAGILLAMRKIKRFEEESGGSQPKIFSSHPPTKERLQYLEAYLKKMNVQIPPESIKTESNYSRIGDVVSVDAKKISFSASDDPSKGDVVWVMREGWDYYYEKRAPVPIARAVVESNGSSAMARYWTISTASNNKITKGMGVYSVPLPPEEKGIGSIKAVSSDPDSLGLLQMNNPPKVLDRLLARQTVWNKDKTRLVVDNVGYIVVTNPQNSAGYVAVTRPVYSYAPVGADATLVALSDPDSAKWVGTIVSIGRGGQTIEVKSNRPVANGKIYEIAYPAWNSEDSYHKRVVGTAKLQSSDKKVVLQMVDYTSGWSIVEIQNGFDIYEADESKK